MRWCYYSAVRPLWNEPRPSLWAQAWEGNAFFITRVGSAKSEEGRPFLHSPALTEDHVLTPDASCFAIRLRGGGSPKSSGQLALLGDDARANLSGRSEAYLACLGIADPDADQATAELIWLHALAIGYAPAYLAEHGDGIRRDWPRIPLPAARARLEASAALGRRVAQLLDTEQQVEGITVGVPRVALARIGMLASVQGGHLNQTSDLALTVNWGYAAREGATMPGGGRVTRRDYTPEERGALDTVAAFAALGDTTLDVFLNERACWRNVPARVWDYTIGGYQVIKKWLSYRAQGVLDRPLRLDEAREVTAMARRIAALLLLEPELNANYRAVTAETYEWLRP